MADRFNMGLMFQPGLTYSPETFEQSMALPLQYRDRQDRMLNQAEELRVKLANVAVPNDERFQQYYNDFKNRTNEEIDNIVNTVSTSGVVNPNVANSLRSLKSNYMTEVSRSGKVGQMARLATEMEQQRGLRLERNVAEGYGAEAGINNYDDDMKTYFNDVNWDRINDPTYSLPTFQARYAPKSTTIEDTLKNNSGLLGSITNSLKTNDLKPEFDSSTGLWTLRNINQGTMTSTNQANLNALEQLIRTQIGDQNSDLMQSALWKARNNGVEVNDETIQEIKENLSKQLMYGIMAMTTRIDSTDNTQTLQVINALGNTMASSSTTGSGSGDDDESGMAKLEMGEAGHRDVDMTTQYTNDLSRVISGEAYQELENMESTNDYKGMSAKQYAQAKNNVIALQRLASKELNEINTNLPVRNEVFKEAYNKKFTTSLTNNINKDYSKMFRDQYRNNTGTISNEIGNTKVSGTSMDKYKLPGMNNSVKDIFNNTNVYNEFIKNKTKYNTEFSKYDDLNSQVLANTPYKNAIGLFYDSFDPENQLMAVNDKGQFVYAVSRNDLNGKVNGLANFGRHQIIQGRDNIAKRLATMNNVDVNTMKDYLKSATNKNLYNGIDGTMKTSVINQNNERLGKNGLKYNGDQMYIGHGTASNKLTEQVNKTLNNNIGTNIFNSAIQSDKSMILIDGEYVNVNKQFNGNASELTSTFSNPQFSLQGVYDNGIGGLPEVGINVNYKDGANKDKTSTLFLTYEADGKSQFVDGILEELEKNLNPYDSSRIKAIRDNAKTNYLYVDNYANATKGTTKSQKNVIMRSGRDVLQETYNNPNYQRTVDFAVNADKSNLYIDPEGYYGFTYKNGTDTQTMNVGQYIFKENTLNAIQNGSMGTTGALTKEADIANNPNGKLLLVQNVYNTIESYNRGLLKIDGITESDPILTEFKNMMYSNMGGMQYTNDDKYKSALAVFNYIKDKRIKHKNKLKLLF